MSKILPMRTPRLSRVFQTSDSGGSVLLMSSWAGPSEVSIDLAWCLWPDFQYAICTANHSPWACLLGPAMASSEKGSRKLCMGL